jgi:hypothetical protein
VLFEPEEDTFVSRYIDTLAPSLYQCVQTRSVDIFFWLLPQPLTHLRFNLFDISETLVTLLHPVMNHFTRQSFPTVKREYLFMNILCSKSFFPQRKTQNRTLLFVSTLLKHGSRFDY